jgi:NADH-quinone oxidoreductase subunit C
METSWVPASEWLDKARALQAEGWFLADLCGLDRLGIGPGDRGEHRFEVVVQLLHHERKERAMIHVPAEGEPPSVPSITQVWAGANFMEREAYDLLGIRFDEHPNLTRILLPDEWEGHPLRKDYGTGKVQVEFKPQPLLQIDAPGQSPAPAEAGARVDRLGQFRVSLDVRVPLEDEKQPAPAGPSAEGEER